MSIARQLPYGNLRRMHLATGRPEALAVIKQRKEAYEKRGVPANTAVEVMQDIDPLFEALYLDVVLVPVSYDECALVTLPRLGSDFPPEVCTIHVHKLGEPVVAAYFIYVGGHGEGAATASCAIRVAHPSESYLPSFHAYLDVAVLEVLNPKPV